MRQKKQIVITLSVLAVIVVILLALVTFSDKNEPVASTLAPSPSPSDTPVISTAPTSQPAASGYKDGTYSATGTYRSPGGTESITISLSIKSGAVTATSATPGAVDPTGDQFQAQFISAYKPQVVGKKLDDINLTHVSGSSLTPRGFNDALQQIKSKAQA